MLAPFYFLVYFGMAVFFLASSPVQAQNFVLPVGLQASWCNTSWSIGGSTYTCTGGNGKVTFPNDAVILSGGHIDIVANSGFELNNAKLGDESSSISLRAPNGGAQVKSAIGAEVSGLIETSGTVELRGTKVYGYLKANGGIELVGGSVAGDVESTNGGVKATGGVVFGGEIKANGDVNLIGGSVEKRVTSTDNKVITQDTSLLGGAAAKSGMTIKGDGNTIIKGDFIFTALNAAYFEGVKMMSGSSIGTAGTAHFKDSVIGTLTNPVDVRVDGSANVRLENTTIYGMVHVPDYGQWSPLITGDSRSHIYGECLRFSGGARPLSDPARLCDGSAVLPDPVDPDPVECELSLIVSPMIAGTTQIAKVTLSPSVPDEPCNPPADLKFSFDYENPKSPSKLLVPSVNSVDLERGDPISVGLGFSSDEDASREIEFQLKYMEAGELTLAVWNAKGELVDSENFVSRPYGFCIQAGSPREDGETDLNKDRFHKAGDEFALEVKAVAWKGDESEGLVLGTEISPLEGLCFNKETVNYRQVSTIALSVMADAQSMGGLDSGQWDPGELKVTSFSHADSHKAKIADQHVTEVGVFRIKTQGSIPRYLGEDMSHAHSQSDPIGRFYPAWLEVGAMPSQNIGCLLPSSATDGFTYQDQSTFLTGDLKVQGFNRVGIEVKNYKEDFWRFTDPLKNGEGEGDYQLHQRFAIPEAGHLSAIAERFIPISSPTMPVFAPTPARAAFVPNKDKYRYARTAVPSSLDNPFSLKMVVWNWHDQDYVYFKRDDEQPEDERGFEPDVPVPVEALIGDSEFRLGRVRSENTLVPFGNSGQAPIMLEHWSGSTWQTVTDNCTTLAVPTDTPVQLSFPDPGVTAATLDVAAWNQSLLQVTATAPSAPQGSVLLRHLLLVKDNGANATWLCRQRSEANAPLGGVCSYREEGDAETRSSITFGIYRGPEPLIFRREVYR